MDARADHLMNRLLKWVAVIALVTSVGGHWAILQGVAWTTMVARFSQTMPLTQALANTLDGQHPCKLCLAVKQGQQEERKESKLKPLEQLLLFIELRAMTLLAPATIDPVFVFREHSSLRSEEPPYPPPRFASFIS